MAKTKRRRAPIRQRQFRHIVASLLARGRSRRQAEAIAAATVNKYRARLARGYLRCRKRRCSWRKGPRLVAQGGSRNQWWPGKKRKRAIRRR